MIKYPNGVARRAGAHNLPLIIAYLIKYGAPDREILKIFHTWNRIGKQMIVPLKGIGESSFLKHFLLV